MIVEYYKWNESYYWGHQSRILLNNCIGCITIQYDNNYTDWGFLYGLSVNPVFRRKGYGKYLVQLAEADIKEHNLNTVKLDVDKTGCVWLVEFYNSLGYEVYDEDNEYYYMKKDLSIKSE